MSANPSRALRELTAYLRSDHREAMLARSGIGSLSLKLLHAVLTLVLAIVLARILGPVQFGVYAFAFALVTVLAIPVQLGLPTLVVRETAAGRARVDAPAVRGVWRWALRFVLAGSALVVAVAAILLLVCWERLDAVSRWTFLWALPLLPLMALGALHGAALRGHDRVVLGQLPDQVLRLGILAALIIAIFAWAGALTAPRAMWLHAVAAALALVISHGLLRRIRSGGEATGKVDPARSRRWMLATLPLGFIAAAQIINTRADTLLLGILADAESVGIYQVAVQGAQAVALGLGAINLVVAPSFVYHYERGDIVQLQRLVTLSARAVALMALPVVLALMIFGGWLIRWFFGVEYREAHLPLAILAASQLANAVFGSVAVLLNMTGYEHDTARGLALAAVLNIVLNLALIPPFGIAGAAVATGVSLVAWNLMLWQSARQLLGINSLVFGSSPLVRQRR